MVRALLGLSLCAVLALVGGAVFLAVSDVHPAPQTVHQTLPDAGLPH